MSKNKNKKKKILIFSLALALAIVSGVLFVVRVKKTINIGQRANPQINDTNHGIDNKNDLGKTNYSKKPINSDDDGSVIVTFNNEQTKKEFLKVNNLLGPDAKKIENTQSYKINKSKNNIKLMSGATLNPNKIYRPAAIPNDPLFTQQWHLNKISATAAWDITKGSSSLKVAVLDTGFALNHQDLASQMDTVNSWDFTNDDNYPMAGTGDINGDFVYHGTMVAGLVGAATNNGTGVSSIGWNTKILPIQVLDDDGYGYTNTVASAIYYAVNKGVKVINLSLGAPDQDDIVRDAVTYAINNGVVIVAAAGNDNCNCIIYPANYPEVIAVGATDNNDMRASFSSYGPNLDVVAPGSGTIRTTSINSSNQTGLYSSSAYGTSMSAPIVAGQAALIKSVKTNASPAEVETYIRNGADKVSGMNGYNFTDEYGYGRANVYKSFSKYQWQYVGQGGLWSLVAGQKTTWTVSARNIGTETWYNSGINPVRLGTSNSNDRISSFCSSGWSNCNRVTTLNEDSVVPGAIGTFTFTIQAPAKPGTYREYFNLVADGAAWMNNLGLFFEPAVSSGNLSSSLVGGNFPATILVGDTANVTLTLKNNGNSYWYKDGKYPIVLGTYSPPDRGSAFRANSWLSPNRVSTMNESSVGPGQNATFTFNIKAPALGDNYYESFSLVAENYKWFNQPISSNISVTLPPPVPSENQFVGSLNANQTLNSNQVLVSSDGRYKLIMQSDGNLVLYSQIRALWWTRTDGKPVTNLAVQGDGNLVLYDNNGKYYWSSWTAGRGGTKLIMQNDGNLVLYNNLDKPVWYTNTAGQM